MELALLLFSAAVALAKPPSIVFPQFSASGESVADGALFQIQLPVSGPLHASFVFSDPLGTEHSCSSERSANWQRTEFELTGRFTVAELAACVDSSADGEFEGQLYLWNADTQSSNGVACRTLPFHYDGVAVMTVQDSEAELSIPSLSWSPSGLMLLEVAYSSPLAYIVNVSNTELTYLGMTLMQDEEHRSEQRLHFSSDQGALNLHSTVHLILDTEQELLFTIVLELGDGELLADNEHGSVDMMIFKDKELREPYISSALSGEELAEGSDVCVVIQDVTGAQLDAGSARICSSASGAINQNGGTCSFSAFPDTITLEIFNYGQGFVNWDLEPEIRDSASRSQVVFCFRPKMLSQMVHVLEVEVNRPGHNNQKRHFDWWVGNHTHGFWFHCPDGYHWDSVWDHCSPDGVWGSLWIWALVAAAFAFLIFCLCISWVNGKIGGDGWFFYQPAKTATPTVNPTVGNRLGAHAQGRSVMRIHDAQKKKKPVDY